VLGGGTALSGMASELFELCEVVARASCGVVVAMGWRSGGPSGLEARSMMLGSESSAVAGTTYREL
jgi:hypothetical protein